MNDRRRTPAGARGEGFAGGSPWPRDCCCWAAGASGGSGPLIVLLATETMSAATLSALAASGLGLPLDPGTGGAFLTRWVPSVRGAGTIADASADVSTQALLEIETHGNQAAYDRCISNFGSAIATSRRTCGQGSQAALLGALQVARAATNGPQRIDCSALVAGPCTFDRLPSGPPKPAVADSL